MPNETTRQHYVPRTYLRKFATERNGNHFLFALPIANPQVESIHEVSIGNACTQKDLYTLPGNTNEERMLLERFYSENYESNYTQIYDILTNPAKSEISKEEREFIISTVVTMMFRTTRLLNDHNRFIDRTLEYAYQLCQQTKSGYFMFEEERISIVGKTLAQLQQEIKESSRPGQVIIQLQTALRLIEIRQCRDGIMVSKLSEDNKEFITSDNPVYFTIPGGETSSSFDPENVLSLPLDSCHKVFLMPNSDAESINRIVRRNSLGTMGFVEKLTSNHSQSKLAERFIYGSRQELEKYIEEKRRQG